MSFQREPSTGPRQPGQTRWRPAVGASAAEGLGAAGWESWVLFKLASGQ